MLTGRAEQADVATARDTGINEYVVKPFSAQTIYDRLERIIEKPRNFVAAPTFVGPTDGTEANHRQALPIAARVILRRSRTHPRKSAGILSVRT